LSLNSSLNIAVESNLVEYQTKKNRKTVLFCLAEAVGFEPTFFRFYATLEIIGMIANALFARHYGFLKKSCTLV
jgi:cyanate lyase